MAVLRPGPVALLRAAAFPLLPISRQPTAAGPFLPPAAPNGPCHRASLAPHPRHGPRLTVRLSSFPHPLPLPAHAHALSHCHARICKENKQFRTPELNDKLFLHFKGFGRIENLEAYTGVKALFLEGNAIDTVEGLAALTQLKCLYLQQNVIDHLGPGLAECGAVEIVNLSNNRLTELSEHLAALPLLGTLQLAHNSLEGLEGLEPLTRCPALQ